MKRVEFLLSFVALSLGLSACSSEVLFETITYNIAGLPQGFNEDQNPEVNVPQIGPLLEPYDLVLVQEDFAYTNELRRGLTQANWSYADPASGLGDGLNQYSRFTFEPELTRERWRQCNGITNNGSDCLTSKGFSHSLVNLDDERKINVINLHMDAGQSIDDFNARDVQSNQVIEFVESLSDEWPLLLAGDTNLKFDTEVDNLSLLTRIQDETGLSDACTLVDCPEPQLIDRAFVRAGQNDELIVDDWRVDETFIDAAEAPLSDHSAVAISLRMKTK